MNEHGVTVAVPTELIELVATRAAELVAERLARQDAEPWPEWMSIETAARYLDCTVQRMRKLVARREVPYSQESPGCRVFFHRLELDRWMADQRVAPR